MSLCYYTQKPERWYAWHDTLDCVNVIIFSPWLQEIKRHTLAQKVLLPMAISGDLPVVSCQPRRACDKRAATIRGRCHLSSADTDDNGDAGITRAKANAQANPSMVTA